jgi:hypothetical protein
MNENGCWRSIFSLLPLLVFGISPSFAGPRLDFPTALEKADAGDAGAAALVATYYWLGWTVAKDPDRALRYAEESASQGHPLGIFRLGSLIRDGFGTMPDEKKGLELQRISMEGLQVMKDDPAALTALAIMHFQGLVVKKDQGLAASLYRRAAEAGYAPAQHNYAMCALFGHGIAKDEAIFSQYITASSSQNYPPSISFLEEYSTSLTTTATPEARWKNGSPEPQLTTPAQGREPTTAAERDLKEKVVQACLVPLNRIADCMPRALESPPFDAALCNELGITLTAKEGSITEVSTEEITRWLNGQIHEAIEAASSFPDAEAFIRADLGCYRTSSKVFVLMSVLSENRNLEVLKTIANAIPSDLTGADPRIRAAVDSCFSPIRDAAAHKVRESDTLRVEYKSLAEKGEYDEAARVLEKASSLDLRSDDSKTSSKLNQSAKKKAFDSLGL